MKKISAALLVLSLSACRTAQTNTNESSQLAAVSDAQFPNINFGEDQKYIPSNAVILTFDDGPDADFTAKVLDTLKEKGVKASFFVNGNNYTNLADDPKAQALIKRIVNEGHEIGNHTVHHYSLKTLSPAKAKEELEGVETEVSRILGHATPLTLIRAPFGEPFQDEDPKKFTKEQSELATTIGKKGVHIGWQIDAQEDRCLEAKTSPDPRACILNGLKKQLSGPGTGSHGVILMHSVHKVTSELLPELIDYLKGKGYVFKSVEDIVRGKYGKSSKDLILGTSTPTAPPTETAGGTPKANESYTIVSRFSDKCVENSNGKASAGNSQLLFDCKGEAKQVYTVKGDPNGAITLTNQGSSMCIDLKSGTAENGTRIIQRGCSAAESQKITLVPAGDNFFKFKLLGGTGCVSIKGPSKENGAELQAWGCNDHPGQQWKFIKH